MPTSRKPLNKTALQWEDIFAWRNSSILSPERFLEKNRRQTSPLRHSGPGAGIHRASRRYMEMSTSLYDIRVTQSSDTALSSSVVTAPASATAAERCWMAIRPGLTVQPEQRLCLGGCQRARRLVGALFNNGARTVIHDPVQV